MRGVAALAVSALAAALLGAAGGSAAPVQTPTLFGEVGPEFEISLRDAQGNRVTQLDPGTYVIEVEDKSDFHTFHLEGPGVDEATDSTFIGDVRWTVTFRDGRYRYFCDIHPTLAGAFTAGTPAPPTPPPAGACSDHREDTRRAHRRACAGDHAQDRCWQGGKDDEASAPTP